MKVLRIFAAGAIAMYFLDPDLGRRRRAQLRDKIGSLRARLPGTTDANLREKESVAEQVGGVQSRLPVGTP